MDNQIIIAWIITAVAGNLAMSWKILMFVINKVNEYNNLKTKVAQLEVADEKKQKDLDAAHKMIRELSRSQKEN